MKEQSGKALSRVGLELWLTWPPVVLIMLLGDDDDDKVMMMSAATDNSGVDDEANLMTFFSRWNELKLWLEICVSQNAGKLLATSFSESSW